MKAYRYIIAAMAAALSLGACTDEYGELCGEGKVKLNTRVSTDVPLARASRADQADLRAELGESLVLWISNSKGVVRQYSGIDNLPTEINLLSGSYVAEAWAGENVPASWDKRWFTGVANFDVTPGATSSVDLTCKIANVVVSVEYAPDVDDVLKDYTLEVGHSRGHLTFDDEHQRGYFMMPKADTGLSWTLTGTKVADGVTTFTRTRTLDNVQPGHEYIFRVSCQQAEEEDLGGAFVNITIDDVVIDREDNVEITVGPIIQGNMFDIDQPLHVQPGLMGYRSVYVNAAGELASMLVTCDQLATALSDPQAVDFDAMAMTDGFRAKLEAAGITTKYEYDAEADASTMRLSFDDTFTDAVFVEDGMTYTIGFEATDSKGRKTSKELKIIVSGTPYMPDPILPDAAANVTETSFTVSGRINQASEELPANPEVTISYKRASDSEWATAPATVSGSTYTATLTGLSVGTTYTYYASVAKADGEVFATAESTVKTVAPQLPNSGMEEWGKDGKANICGPFGSDGKPTFWGNGNGATAGIMSVNVTGSSTSVAHSGTSAELKSQFVGFGSLGSFAAGNLFAGEFLNYSMNPIGGQLGMGRPFAYRPVALKVWVKYTPATVSKYTYGNVLKSGDLDKGNIYIALLDDNMEEYNGKQYPFIVDTTTGKTFDPTSSHVIGYGEITFDAATDGMVQVTIPIDYRSSATPTSIVLTCSASKYGDYFAGGEGSLMYLDDFELVYE